MKLETNFEWKTLPSSFGFSFGTATGFQGSESVSFICGNAKASVNTIWKKYQNECGFSTVGNYILHDGSDNQLLIDARSVILYTFLN